MSVTEQEALERFPALGGIATVAVTDAAMLPEVRELVEQTVARFDRAASTFRTDSELAALNASAGATRPVSDVLFDAVRVAVRGAELTEGDVDPTVGEALLAVSGSDPISITSVPGWRAITLDERSRTIRLARGVSLDLGATAKALAADRAADIAARATGGGVLVSLSGDIALAGPAPPSGWRVRVTDDHRADEHDPGQWVTVRSGGLATSSTTVRTWSGPDGERHHVIDPATGRPATVVWRTVSVAAGSCVDANIASTAAIVRGQRAVPWLESLGLPSRLVSADGTARHLVGWPADGDDLA